MVLHLQWRNTGNDEDTTYVLIVVDYMNERSTSVLVMFVGNVIKHTGVRYGRKRWSITVVSVRAVVKIDLSSLPLTI